MAPSLFRVETRMASLIMDLASTTGLSSKALGSNNSKNNNSRYKFTFTLL